MAQAGSNDEKNQGVENLVGLSLLNSEDEIVGVAYLHDNFLLLGSCYLKNVSPVCQNSNLLNFCQKNFFVPTVN